MDYPWKLAFLDFDGPIARSGSLYYRASCEMFRACGIKSPPFRVFRNGIGTVSTDIDNFFRRHGIPEHVTTEKMDAIKKTYLDAHWHEVTPTPHAKQFLEFWSRRGMPVVVVSGNEEKTVIRRLEEFGFLDLVRRVVATPNKEEALLNMLDTFGVNAQNAFLVDDTVEGLLAAKGLGIVTIGFTGGFNTKRHLMEIKPDFPNRAHPRVDTLRQVTKILLNGTR